MTQEVNTQKLNAHSWRVIRERLKESRGSCRGDEMLGPFRNRPRRGPARATVHSSVCRSFHPSKQVGLCERFHVTVSTSLKTRHYLSCREQRTQVDNERVSHDLNLPERLRIPRVFKAIRETAWSLFFLTVFMFNRPIVKFYDEILDE